jgi:DNA polymerase-3 subunit delta
MGVCTICHSILGFYMSAEQIISDWKKKNFKPVYWLEGEEPYYIDKLTKYAEEHLLPEDQVAFNLSIFYGKDSKVEEVINACRRYPMFHDLQVVVLKEAQQLRDLDKLESYINHPLTSTVLVVAHKEKKVDGRSKLAKILKGKAEVVSTKKLYDNELPEWTSTMITARGLSIQSKALQMLVGHIGNDLQRIENEIEKLSINLSGRKQINEDDIEQYIGVSKEFNIFELQAAVVNRDLPSALNIINYFASNPKAAPIQLILPTFYSFFSKLYIAASSPTRDEYSLSALLGLKGFFVKQYIQALQRYSFADIEKVLLLLSHYNLLSVGIGRVNADDATLMKEMVTKMISKDV